MSETNTKRSMGFSMRHLSWRACWCQQCRSGKKARRSLHKASRQEWKQRQREAIKREGTWL